MINNQFELKSLSKSRQLVEQQAQSGRCVFVVLPAYNEALGLPPLLSKIRSELNGSNYRVIVVDDASVDETNQIASRATFEMPLELVSHGTNKGLSGALNSGLRRAARLCSEDDVIVTLDADNTHPPATIHQLLEKIDEGYEVVVASRYQTGSEVIGVPANRVWMTHFARYLFKTIMPIKGIRDYTCGFRAYRADVIRNAIDHYGDNFVSEKGFSCMADVLLKIRKFGHKMGEVPFSLRYDWKEGESKMPVASTAWTTLKLLMKRRLAGY